MQKVAALLIFLWVLLFSLHEPVVAGAIMCTNCCTSVSECEGYAQPSACGSASPTNPGVSYISCINIPSVGRGDCNAGCGVCSICNGNPECEVIASYYCSGGGGGYYDYSHCPAGQAKSCGTESEAQAQNKYQCVYKAFCDNYFSPAFIGDGCDADNPAKAMCQANCSCCAPGSSRSCTQGSQYDVTITIDLTVTDGVPNESVEARNAKKVSCAQWHGHEDIFVSNVMTRDYYNEWDDHLQDWKLTCIQNTCGCVAPPTPTPGGDIRARAVRVDPADTSGTTHDFEHSPL